jgi:hypothetical protein
MMWRMSAFDPKRTSAPVVPVATSARFWHQPRHECTKRCQQHLPENLAGGSRAARRYRYKPRRGSWPDGQASVDANRLALRSQAETDDVAVPQPGDGEDDGEKRQQHAEDEEGFAARDRRGEPSGVSDEERLARAAAIIKRAANNGLTEVEVARFPNELCTDRGRAINQREPGWEKTLTGYPKELYDFWQKHLKARGYTVGFQIVDFPGGRPGNIGITLRWN